VDALTASKKLDEMLIIDVREAYEVEEGHLPGAAHIPIGQLSYRMYDLTGPGRSCSSARRGSAAAPVRRSSRTPVSTRTTSMPGCGAGG